MGIPYDELWGLHGHADDGDASVPDGGSTEECPACGTEVTDPNPDADSWYCESGQCEVVLFGPQGLGVTDRGGDS